MFAFIEVELVNKEKMLINLNDVQYFKEMALKSQTLLNVQGVDDGQKTELCLNGKIFFLETDYSDILRMISDIK